LEHGDEGEPHVEQPPVVEELEGDRPVGEDVVQVAHQGPVAVVLGNAVSTVHHRVEVLPRSVGKGGLALQGALVQDEGHHGLEADDHDVQQVGTLSHAQGQGLVGEELHAHVHHPVRERLRVHRLGQHLADAAVVLHKGLLRIGLYLVVGVWQHVEQKADQLLGKLKLDHPEDQFLQEAVVDQKKEWRQKRTLVLGWALPVLELALGLLVALIVLADEVGLGLILRLHCRERMCTCRGPVAEGVGEGVGHHLAHHGPHLTQLVKHGEEAVGLLYRLLGFTGIGCVAVLPQVLDEPQDDAGHHGLGHAEQVRRRRGLALLGLGAVPVAEPASTLHIAGPPSLAAEHVEVVALVVALLEAVGTQRHAGRDAARAAPVRHKVGRPHQAACRRIVVPAH
ncbi:unnamed protein product, partial [Ixodes pacificus]